MTRPAHVLAPLAALLLSVACSSKESTPTELSQPATLIVASGDGQTAVGPVALSAPLVLRVTDVKARGVANVTVTWVASDADARLSAPTSSTDAQGQATVQWTLGAAPGRQTVTGTVVSISGAKAVFQAVNGVAAKIVIVSGDNQVGDAGSALGTPLVVKVTDALDRPAPNLSVTWAASGDGSISPATVNTDAQGQATASWTLSNSPGAQSAEAASAGPPLIRTVFRASNGATISGGVTISNGALGSITPTSTGAGGALASPSRQTFAGTIAGGAKRMLHSSSLTAERLRTTGTPTRRLIVEFKPRAMGMGGRIANAGSSAIQSVLNSMTASLSPLTGAGIVHSPEYSPMILATRVTVAEGGDLDAAMAALRANADVESVTPDEIVPMLENYVATEYVPISKSTAATALAIGGAVPGVLPNDPLLLPQYWHYNMIDMPRAWAGNTGSASVLVAIVDNGIRPTHPGNAANLTTDGYNFVAAGNRLNTAQPVCTGGTTLLPEAGPGPDPTAPDDLSFTGTCWSRSTAGNHGGHVAGTIGGVGNDGVGGTGINWTVRMRAVRGLDITGSGSFFDIAQGVLYAAGLPASNGAGSTVTAPSRAALINMSLGGSSNTSVLANAVTAATNAGTLIIASAGNNSDFRPSYPAAYPEVVSVVAIGADMQLAEYTTVGTTVSLSAPGGSFRFANTAGVVSSTWNFQTSAPNYAYYEGTSMAAPHVTGVAALVLSANPNMTGAQLRARLQNTAVDLGPPGRDDRYGYGLVNANNALRNSSGPRADTYVRLVESLTGTTVKTTPVRADGSYAFSRLAPGSYYVFAGQDENSDQITGMPGRRWGWFGTNAGPQLIQLSATTNAVASIHLGLPVEAEPNNSIAQAMRIPMNGYVAGQIATPDLTDFYSVIISSPGTYYFETTGVVGSCGYGIELDTVLALLDGTGTVLASNDDTVFPSSQFCSAVSMALTPGTYYLRVTGALNSVGQYRLWVRNTP